MEGEREGPRGKGGDQSSQLQERVPTVSVQSNWWQQVSI